MANREVKEKIEQTIIALADRCVKTPIAADDVESLANAVDYLSRALERLDPTAGKS